MDSKSLIYFFLVLFAAFVSSNAESQSISDAFSDPELVRFLLAGTLSAIAAAISNAGGIGGGGLFVPILTIVAGLDVKTATAFSAFMVTGGSVAKISCYAVSSKKTKARIDYDIVLLSEPALLLGVSCGVILNRVLPEWLITMFFAVLIAFCTLKTCKSGVLYWRRESQGISCGQSTRKPLLMEEAEEGKLGIPWRKLGMLLAVWVSFFILYLFRGNSYGQGIIKIKACGKAYWIISLMQIPLAILFTTWILFCPKTIDASPQQENGGLTGHTTRHPSGMKLIFPVMALFAGLLGGVFGIGGGMVISPLLLQIGIEPEVTGVTCSFIVLFSSTMSAIQYALLGMEGIHGALALAAVCFVASMVGSTLVQRAVTKHGRASLIVFVIGTVMGLSTVAMTSFGAVETWKDYTNGKSMGFNNPCGN